MYQFIQGIKNAYQPSIKALVLPLLLAAVPAFGQSSTEQALIQAGFENVTVQEKGDTLQAALESLNYRGSYRTLGTAIKEMARQNPLTKVFQVLALENLQPQMIITATKQGDQWYVQTDYDTASLAQQLLSSKVQAHNSSIGKVDITFYPIVSIDNHKLHKLADVGVFLAPSIETTLWKGNRIYIQPIVPIFYDLHVSDPDRQPQLGIIGIRQEWLNNKRWSIASTLGTFLYNQYGLHTEVTYRANRQLNFGLNLGFTGDQTFTSNGWETKKPKNLLAMANVDYYHRPTSMQVKLSGGSFLYGDFGMRLDLVRHFGEFALGVFAIYTDGEFNPGFNFAIPLSTRRQMRKGKVRLRFPQYFSWEYNMVNYFRYGEKKMGRTFKERPDKSFTTHYWQAAYLEHYLQRCLNGIIR